MTDTGSGFDYKDASRPVDERVEDLLSRMDLVQKAGQLFQPLASLGELDAPGMFGSPSTQAILDKGITHLNILQAHTARELAQWHNTLQAAALEQPLGIPITVSTDPRHAFADNPATQLMAGPFSQWPEFLGFGAIDDPELTRQYADTVRREYLAVGIRTALHPQIDLATEPRWARVSGVFSESADVTTRQAVAYVKGLQGDTIGAESVSAMAKHFPGGGPQKDGEDPHFAYGREQVYPGGQFDLHLEPFKAVIAAGVSQIMPYYGMPVDTEYEEVGFSFNKQIITGLLREQLSYDGIVCSDWGILSGTFWGVEHLTYQERMLKAFDAGIDQFGGEFQPDVLIDLVRSGQVTEERIDVSVRRVLREKFRLGLFENPFVDAAAADQVVGTAQAREAGLAAQAAAVTVLVNGQGPAELPLSGQPKVYLEHTKPDAYAGWANVVLTPEEADVAIIRTVAPWEQRGVPGDIEFFFHAGSLDFHAEQLAHIREIAAKVPTILDVYLDRPAILAPVAELVSTLTVNFGASDDAFVRVLFGQAEPKGNLPFDIPSSMAAVVKNRPDVPFDTENPTFRFGHGLRYQDWTPVVRPDPSTTTTARPDASAGLDLNVVTLSEILENPSSRAVIDELLPELPANPMLDMIKGMPFETVLTLAAGELPAELGAQLRSRLTSLS
ncbi:MAG: glycoside hydrolase family 3 C-terminal domain-containing protein [Propionibacterium sp.]|nr:glycoside hydrolase family 3 C-terminal domain-containing protein [Propionibacterium sp.]